MDKKINGRIAELLATFFYIGYIPFMPGTFGTIAGVIIFVFLSKSFFVYYGLLIAIAACSVWVSGYAEKHIFETKDPKAVVIDEVAGFLIAMISFQFNGTLESLKYLVIGFILFRFFDIWKPYPIWNLQKLKGGWGIVLDDLMAGIYTNIILQFIRHFGQFLCFNPD
jgi:phosphatidylglycerophosphatase A